MDLGSLLVVLALSIMAATFIAQPLSERNRLRVSEEERHFSELLAERDRVLTTLQDLDMDYAMGKVLQEDYHAQRGALLSQGADILRAIDKLRGTVGEVLPDMDLDLEIETAVARLRQGEDQARGEYCRSCGREVIVGDRFCAHCGAALLEEGV